MSTHYIDIIDRDSGKAIESLGPYEGDWPVDRAEHGVNINLDHEQYFTQTRMVSI